MKRIICFIVGSLFILGIVSFSWAKEMQNDAKMKLAQAKASEATIEVATTKEAVDVGNTICSVSGEKIDEKTKATYEYEGKIYNFCCPMCIDEFKKDPEKYIKKIEEQMETPSEEKAEKGMGMMEEHKESNDMHSEHHH